MRPYLRNKKRIDGGDDESFKDIILNYIGGFGSGYQLDFEGLLLDKLLGFLDKT